MAVIDEIIGLLKVRLFEPQAAERLVSAFRKVLAASGALTIKESTATVSAAVTSIDFGAGFDVTELPAGEANIAIDLSEVTAFTDVLADVVDLGVKTISGQFGDGVTVIPAGTETVEVTVPWACTITKARMFAKPATNAVIDVWVDTYANAPPTIADTITAAAKPTLSAATKSEDAALTGWTTSIAAGSVVIFKVDSCSAATRLTCELTVERT